MLSMLRELSDIIHFATMSLNRGDEEEAELFIVSFLEGLCEEDTVTLSTLLTYQQITADRDVLFLLTTLHNLNMN
jgi:hypothetical protein